MVDFPFNEGHENEPEPEVPEYPFDPRKDMVGDMSDEERRAMVYEITRWIADRMEHAAKNFRREVDKEHPMCILSRMLSMHAAVGGHVEDFTELLKPELREMGRRAIEEKMMGFDERGMQN